MISALQRDSRSARRSINEQPFLTTPLVAARDARDFGNSQVLAVFAKSGGGVFGYDLRLGLPAQRQQLVETVAHVDAVENVGEVQGNRVWLSFLEPALSSHLECCVRNPHPSPRA